MEEKTMPKVIELKPNPIINILESLLSMAKEGTLDSIVLAGFTKDKEIVTARSNVDLIEQQHLVSFMQIDATLRTIKESTTEIKK
jgi:hypothetical protein